MTALLLGVLAASARADCLLDAQGSDDQPGQKDLSQFCLGSTCNVSGTDVSWNFDDTNWNGSNTGDACALFDTNGDGDVERAVCVTIESPAQMQAGNPKCYTCGNTRPDRCTSSALVSCASTCSVGSDVDPYAGDPSHTASKCNGTNCRTTDTQTDCCLTPADAGGGILIDVCSYPSQQPNSDPSDCIVGRSCSKTDPNDPDCDDDNPCTVDSCDTTFGVCHHVAGNQGAQCRGALGVCDAAESCDGTSIFCPDDQFAQGGVCRNASDLCDVAETCDGSSAGCPADGAKATGTPCRSAVDQCDVAESCDGSSPACPDDGFQPNDTPCNDNNNCTTGDVCTGGSCVGGPPPDCDDTNVCTDDSCNPSTPGGCVHTNNSDPCNDNDACTTDDGCSDGLCVGGPPPDCNDTNPCTTDGCNMTTGCTHTNNSDPCTDGDECTIDDTCTGGQCIGGPPPDCADTNACTADSCVSPTGCDHAPVASCCNVDAECVEVPDDQCTTNERCVDHACVSDPVDCDDRNACTDEECHPNTGCVYTNNNDPCSDGSECTTDDACSGGSCAGGPAPDCDDHDVCTDDDCNPTTPGGCVHSNNTAPCSDGSECTTNDHCQADVCVGGPAPNCDDQNECTDDSCNPSTPGGCEHANKSKPCDDGNGCTVGDVCSGGVCRSGAPKDCSDHEGCTDDSCLAPSGICQNLNNADPCDDGDPCTVDDRCGGGSCQQGHDLDCNDHLDCTTDSCSNGCQHTPVPQPCCEEDSDCIDSDECTINERCVDNACVSDPRDCDDPNPCTVDRCDNQGGGFLCIHDNCCNLPDSPCPSSPECACNLPSVCGNGVIDPGETCDPPDTTINPVSGQVTCRLDCTSCGDGVPQTDDGETCDDGNAVSGCDPAHPRHALDACKNNCTLPICSDPAKVFFAPLIDRFQVHGRLATDSFVDFSRKTLVVELTDRSRHVIFRRSLEAGEIHPSVTAGRFRYTDRAASRAGGIARLRVTRQTGAYRLTLSAYGNLFKSQTDMLTNVYVQDQKWTVPCAWHERAHGWSCTGRFTLQ